MNRICLQRGTLVLVMGVAGSGKSTLARGVLRKVQAVYLDNNFIVDAFFPDTRTDSEYLELRPNFYNVLYRIAEENLRIGNSVIIDAPHVRQMQDAEWRHFLQRLVTRTGAALAVVRCCCSEETLRGRLSRRGLTRDAAKLRDWDMFLSKQPLLVEIPFRHLDIDTEESLALTVGRAVDYIVERSGGP